MFLPQIKMPPAEAELVRETYRTATTILEYGSGGSTVFAAGQDGKFVMSVESDQHWCKSLDDSIREAKLPATVHMVNADVGPTGAWGMPLNERAFRRFPGYALDIWDAPFFRQPDVVLVDGRARPACFLATLFRTAAPVTVLFDDYTSRPAYAEIVEKFAIPRQTVGRMAVFDVAPILIDPAKLALIVATLCNMEIDRTHIGRRIERTAKQAWRRLRGS